MGSSNFGGANIGELPIGGLPTSGQNAIKVSSLIYRAFRIANILKRGGRSYSPSELSDGLQILNDMVDAWKNERLMVYAVLRQEWDIQANQQSYTIGLSGSADFTAERPVRIERAGYIYTDTSPNIERPLEVYLSEQQWAALSPKALNSALPRVLYYERVYDQASMDGRIWLWPIPANDGKIALYHWLTVNEFATQDDEVIIPNAYRNAIIWNLAVEAGEQFKEQAVVTPLMIEKAREYKAIVKAMNAPAYLMQVESSALGGATGRYDIFSNRWS